MKRYFLLLLLAPAMTFAQVKKSTKPIKKAPVKTAPAKTAAIPKDDIQKPVDGFLIKGTVKGYPDGTTVGLFNGSNGTAEGNAILKNGAFSFTGTTPFPDFRIIAFDGVAPYITIFLDNSLVTVKATKDSLDDAIIKGSPSHDEFAAFAKISKPYDKIFSGEETADDATRQKAAAEMLAFVQQHPKSFIAPLAVYRNFQMTENYDLLESQFNAMSAEQKQTPIGGYIAKQVADNKKNPIGKPLGEFSQADTAGVQVALSSLKGKYVLVDFWASWCRPCRMENPNVVNVYNRFKDKNFTVLGVSLDQAKPAWLDAIRMDNLTWTNVSDLKGWGNAVAQQFEIFSIPQNFLLDPNGNVVGKNLRGPALESKLESLLK